MQNILSEKLKGIESLKSRLPVNADGDVIFVGMEQYYWCPFAKRPVKIIVSETVRYEHESKWRIGQAMIATIYWPQQLFSTAESCRAANETKEG